MFALTVSTRLLLFTAGWTAALFALTFVVVRRHYAASLPHFDSMGGFSLVWQMMNLTETAGYRIGFLGAIGKSTSWLQPLFGVLVAGWPFRSPEAVVALNFGLLFLTQLALLNYGRVFGFSMGRQLVMIALPVLPAVASGWNGGLQDFRRDSQLFIVITGALMQSLAYVERPSRANGLFLGLLGGLTLWSRDNSAFMLAIVMLPAVIMSVWRGYATSGLAGIIRRAGIPLLTFMALLVPYYALTFELTVRRYTTNVWGFGNDRLPALLSTWETPWQVVFGGRYATTSFAGAMTTLAVLTGICLILGVCWLRGYVRICPRQLASQPYALPLLSGAVVAVGIIMFNALIAGIPSGQSGMPYLPLVAPVVAMLVGLSGLVSRTTAAPRAVSVGLPILASLVILVSCAARMVLNEPPAYGEANVSAFRQLALELGRQGAGRTTALLWTEDFSRHHMDFYLTQAGYPVVMDFASRATERGYRIDLDQPLRPTDQPDELRQRLDTALRTYAEFVVVCLDASQYENAQGTRLWPYTVGRPVVERLLQDPTFKMVQQFTISGRQFAILENLQASPDTQPRTN